MYGLYIVGTSGNQRCSAEPAQFRIGKGGNFSKEGGANIPCGSRCHARGNQAAEYSKGHTSQRNQNHQEAGGVNVTLVALDNTVVDDIRHVSGKSQFAHGLAEEKDNDD